MASFTLSAVYQGRDVRVTWTDGKLSGDSSVVGTVAGMAVSLEGKPIVTPAGIIEHDHMTDPYAAYQIISMVLGENALFITGNFSSIPPTPGRPNE